MARQTLTHEDRQQIARNDTRGEIATKSNANFSELYDRTVSTTATPKTANHTLVLGDLSTLIEMNVGSANTVTVPPNADVAFPVGTLVDVCQVGAGATTLVAGSGVTINTPGTLVLRARWSTVRLRKRATDEWVVSGDVALT